MTKLLHIGRYEITPGKKADLNKDDPNETSGFEGKDDDGKGESQAAPFSARTIGRLDGFGHRSRRTG